MTSFKTLLAKSSKHPDSPEQAESLFGHTSAVLDLSYILIIRLTDPLQSLLKLAPSDTALWKRSVQIAAWLHDWGKANDHFQTIIRPPCVRIVVTYDRGERRMKMSPRGAPIFGATLHPFAGRQGA